MTDSALPLFQRTAILGLGLMGGSLGLALRACGAIASIIGFDPAEGVAEAAIQAGAIERSAPTATTAAPYAGSWTAPGIPPSFPGIRSWPNGASITAPGMPSSLPGFFAAFMVVLLIGC